MKANERKDGRIGCDDVLVVGVREERAREGYVRPVIVLREVVQRRRDGVDKCCHRSFPLVV